MKRALSNGYTHTPSNLPKQISPLNLFPSLLLLFQARPLISHALETEEFGSLADPKLGGNYVDSEMFRMIEAAGACVRYSAAKRPRMGQVT